MNEYVFDFCFNPNAMATMCPLFLIELVKPNQNAYAESYN